MGKNINLNIARKNKNDEFYTRYEDIEKEIECYFEYDNNVFRNKTILLPCDDYSWSNFTKYFIDNFKRFGLKKLISTCISEQQIEVKNNEITLFTSCEDFEKIENLETRGKLFIKNRDEEIEDYLEGDGDFRSDEVCQLRNQSDIIITNPPFSLFRDFVDWLFEGNKKFAIIGNINSISCKNIFSLIKENKMWLGASIRSGDRDFIMPDTIFEKGLQNREGDKVSNEGKNYVRVMGIRWYTNIPHNKRNKWLELNTMEENIKIMGNNFERYDNYKAINVDKTKWVPSDYKGVMGVPISFLDKYNPDQFEILGKTNSGGHAGIYLTGKHATAKINTKSMYHRILIKHKRIEEVK